MRRLNVAIIGQGRSGFLIHAAHIKRDADRFCLKYVVDAMPERREKARNLFGCETYADYTALFDKRDIDVVVNSSFSREHYLVAKAFVSRGFNVISEKPFAGTPEEVDDLISAARASGAMLAPFQQSRLAPYFTKVREVVDSGVLGRVMAISIQFSGFARRWDWQTIQDNMAGSLFNTGPHPLDQALTLLGGDCMPDIYCKMDRVTTLGDAEDYVKLILTLPGRPLIDIEISSSNAYPWGTYNVQGTHGGLWASQSEVKWRWFEPALAPERHVVKTPLTTESGDPAYCTEALPWREDSWKAGEGDDAFVGAVMAFYTNIYEHITAGAPLIILPEEVRRQIAVILRAHELNPMDKFC